MESTHMYRAIHLLSRPVTICHQLSRHVTICHALTPHVINFEEPGPWLSLIRLIGPLHVYKSTMHWISSAHNLYIARSEAMHLLSRPVTICHQLSRPVTIWHDVHFRSCTVAVGRSNPPCGLARTLTVSSTRTPTYVHNTPTHADTYTYNHVCSCSPCSLSHSACRVSCVVCVFSLFPVVPL